jgi:hypothetical protein
MKEAIRRLVEIGLKMRCIVLFTGPTPQINAGRLESIQRDVTMMLRGDKFSSMRGDALPLIGWRCTSSPTTSHA